jgi:hypothetical protein
LCLSGHEEGGMHADPDVYLFVVSIGARAFGGALGMASGIFIVPLLTFLMALASMLSTRAHEEATW